MSIKQNSTFMLLQNLVAIPSFVGENADERQLAEFVYQYLVKFKFLKVQKQPIGNSGRFNVIATTPGKPRLFLGGHLDTVPRQEGWQGDPIAGRIEGTRFYGLGAYDMKGGCAAIMDAISLLQKAEGLFVLFYCDEEYDFAGMKKFLAEYPEENGIPELAMIAEPSDLEIWNAHRGIVEIHLQMFGKTGHAKNPKEGNNAIDALYQTIDFLRTEFEEATPHQTLGLTTLNLSSLHGGINKGTDSGGKIKIGQQGNMIADYAECVIDIRTNSPDINGKILAAKMVALAQTRFGCRLETKIAHDFGALYTAPEKIQVVEKAIATISGKNAQYADGADKGFGDGQFLQEKFGIPVVNLGPLGDNAHKPNEWVDIDSLEVTRDIYSAIIQHYCGTP